MNCDVNIFGLLFLSQAVKYISFFLFFRIKKCNFDFLTRFSRRDFKRDAFHFMEAKKFQ